MVTIIIILKEIMNPLHLLERCCSATGIPSKWQIDTPLL